MGNYAQLHVRDGHEPPETGLRRVHAQVLNVSPGWDHIRGMDLVREDGGVLEELFHTVLLEQQNLSGIHVQRRKHWTDLEVRHRELGVLP